MTRVIEKTAWSVRLFPMDVGKTIKMVAEIKYIDEDGSLYFQNLTAGSRSTERTVGVFAPNSWAYVIKAGELDES